MASPQLENGYTRIATEILEKLSEPGINGSEYRITLFVIRKTYGFNKTKDRISLSQFEKGTKMNRKQAIETIKSLVGKSILLKENGVYRLNKNWEQWVVCKRTPSGQKHTGVVGKSTPKVVGKSTHTIDNKQITINKSEHSSQEINLLIKSFESINPACKRMYGNTTQRQACQDLIESYTYERVIAVIENTLPKIKDMPYFPTITTPLKLRDKWVELESAIFKYRNKELQTKQKNGHVY